MTDKKYTHNLICTLFMKNEETRIEDFYKFFYEKKKIEKWLSFFPFIWFKVDKDYYDEGAVMTFKFSPLPFAYDIRCYKKLANNTGFLVKIEGHVHGEGRIELIKQQDGIFLHHELNISGNSKFSEMYYSLISKGHNGYMNWRLSILKKSLIKYSAVNKEKVNE